MSLSHWTVVTFTLSQTDTIGGASAFNSTGNSSRVGSQSDYASWGKSMRNAALLGLMKPNLETGARQTGRYTLFLLAGGNFREIGHFVWNLLAFTLRGSVERCWKVSSIPFFYSVQYSMERKSTKRRLNRS